MKLTNLTYAIGIGVAMTLAGCGSDGGCEAVDYETHLDQQHSTPDELEIMLHHASRTCSAVGANTYHAYFIPAGEDSGHGKPRPAQHDDGHGGDASGSATPLVDVVAVSAFMPAHGHGTAVDPQIDPDDPAFFTVDYQMPGTWELTLQVSVPAVTHTVQTVVFTLDVTD